MLDPQTAALLRAVLDELCEHVPRVENATRAHVASKILEAATKDAWTVDDLKAAGRQALQGTRTMWR